MKKKTIALCGIAALAGLSLASCKKDGNLGVTEKPAISISTTHNYVEAPADVTYSTDGGRLDIYVNYSKTDGITYRKSDAFTNLVDGVNYTQGTLLPTWKAFAEKTKTQIYDAAGYTTKADDDTYSLVKNNSYKSDKDSTQNIDLFYNTVKNINKMGGAGEAVNLVQYLDKMPNFKAFLEKNPTIRKTMEVSGKIYYTPYFDGYNDIERMFVMDTSLVEKVLDAENFDGFDTSINGGANPAANVVKTGAYTPYVDENYNYPDKKTKVNILVGQSEVQEITIKQTDNIIKKQNELLAAGCTGAQLAQQFRTYLNTAFGDYIGKNKPFASYSDIFCSESAAYNADELIALMRVVKANPGVITADPNAEVETFFPRGQADNRVDNIADLIQIFGIQGMTAEKDMLYFDANGKLHDAATTPATYDALQKLSAIYDEGLIVDEFWYKPAQTDSNYYLNKYFKKTAEGAGYGLLMYDYSASQCVANDMYNGVGTNPDSRKIKVEQKGIKPILPPLAYWGNTKEYDQTQALSNHANKTLMRYAEENRALKNNSWCIPTSTDNLDGALRLMDFMFTEKGAMIQDFGPEAYWQQPDTANGDTVEGTYDANKIYVATDIVAGQKTPVISNKVKAMMSKNPMDFWSFMRGYIGNTHGIGCQRSKGLDIQATNGYGQIGLTALKNAIAAGVVDLALVDKVKDTTTWDTTVPTAGYGSITTEVSNTYEALTKFWESKKCSATADGWVKVVAESCTKDLTNEKLGTATVSGEYTYAKVKSQMEIKNKAYLFTMANSLGESFIPDYAKSN